MQANTPNLSCLLATLLRGQGKWGDDIHIDNKSKPTMQTGRRHLLSVGARGPVVATAASAISIPQSPQQIRAIQQHKGKA